MRYNDVLCAQSRMYKPGLLLRRVRLFQLLPPLITYERIQMKWRYPPQLRSFRSVRNIFSSFRQYISHNRVFRNFGLIFQFRN